jgi:hypothetical protein
MRILLVATDAMAIAGAGGDIELARKILNHMVDNREWPVYIKPHG